MASVVTLEIKVQDEGGVATIQKEEQALKSLGDAAAGIGPKAKAGTDAAANGVKTLGGHTTTGLDQVRLLSQEFGLRLPRAMEAALSRMPGLMTAIGGFSSGLLAIGGAEVIFHLGEALYDAEQKYVSITAAADKFYESMKKASEADFVNPHSIEAAEARLRNVEERIRNAPQVAASLQKVGIGALMDGLGGAPGAIGAGIGLLHAAHGIADDGALAMQQSQALTVFQNEKTHEQALAQIELNHALDATLGKRQQIAAETAKAQQIDHENRKYTRIQDGQHSNLDPSSAGAEEQREKDAQANAAAAAKMIELNQEVALAIMKSRDAATQAGLQGEQLYHQKQIDGVRELIAELNAQHLVEEVPARVRALNLQYDNERLLRIQKLTEETEKQARAASSAGLTGAARILAERNATLGEIDSEQKKATLKDGSIDPTVKKDFDNQRVTAGVIATQKLAELEQQFTDRTRGMVAQRTEAALGGYDRITAAAQREVDELQRQYDRDFANAELTAHQKEEVEKNLAAAKAAINAAAEQQKSQLAAKNRADDLQYDREAAQAEARVRAGGIAGWVNSYRDGIAEIRAQEEQRMAKLTEDAQREGLQREEVEQRKRDIERTANADIAAQNQQLQHQIAGDLQQAFTNPTDFIKQKMQQMMFEIIAGWVMRLQIFKDLFGDTMGSLQPGGNTNAGASGGGVLGRLTHMGVPTGSAGWSNATAPNYGAAQGGYSGTATSEVHAATPQLAAATAPNKGDTVGGIMGDANSLVSLGRKLNIPSMSSTSASPSVVFPKPEAGGNTRGALGTEDGDAEATGEAAAGGGALDAAMGYAAAGYGAYTGGKGVYDSFFEKGAKGAMDGTLSGAEAGMAVGSFFGPMGTLIGAGVGAVVGLGTNLIGQLTGESDKVAARDYYQQTLLPQLEGFETSFTGDNYLSAVSQANSASAGGFTFMQHKFGNDAASWVKSNYLDAETKKVDAAIVGMAGSGRQYLKRQAAEFHEGGAIRTFGDFATSSEEGFIHAKVGEGIVTNRGMADHGPAVHAINAGASAADIAAMYLQSVEGLPSSGGASTNHYHTHTYSALDAQSFEQFLDRGGAETIEKSANKRASVYAGDGGF